MKLLEAIDDNKFNTILTALTKKEILPPEYAVPLQYWVQSESGININSLLSQIDNGQIKVHDLKQSSIPEWLQDYGSELLSELAAKNPKFFFDVLDPKLASIWKEQFIDFMEGDPEFDEAYEAEIQNMKPEEVFTDILANELHVDQDPNGWIEYLDFDRLTQKLISNSIISSPVVFGGNEFFIQLKQ